VRSFLLLRNRVSGFLYRLSVCGSDAKILSMRGRFYAICV